AEHADPVVDAFATVGSWPGTFPAVVIVALAVIGVLWFRGRPWRESAAVLWSFLASEALGLVLLFLLRARDIEPVRAEIWPSGFAGLIPLRAFAVFGMSAKVLAR